MGLRGGIMSAKWTRCYSMVPARSRQGRGGSAEPDCESARCESHSDRVGLVVEAISDHATYPWDFFRRTSRAECCGVVTALDRRRIRRTVGGARVGWIPVGESGLLLFFGSNRP